ncbi:MAG: hypothetical protein K0Q49_897 [Haloplasmataceae bacterium]|nr:hypothetical protein [Haloplasmataceae bacterium]
MKITGIIVEYNPLHNGHLYHISETKKRAHCDFLIAVMSGNFVMRGEPALLNKQLRAELALKSGIDLVVELPYPFSVASADLFAYGAISILNNLNVDDIYFGSETDDVQALTLIAETLDTERFNAEIKIYLNQGLSYPKACENVLKSLHNSNYQFNANDILAIQYIRSILKINNQIKYYSIKRIHNDYNDQTFSHDRIASATSIRNALDNNITIDQYVPSYTSDILKTNKLVHWDDFYPYLKYQINVNQNNLHLIHDVNEGIEHAILNNINQYDDFNTFVASLVSKRYTTSKIKRILTHILNNVTKAEVNLTGPQYIRILGINKSKSYVLKEIHSNIPIITNINKNNYDLIQLDERISQTYHFIDQHKLRKIPIFYE